MGKPEADITELHRVLYLHRWSDLEDWVRALDDLAGMTDDQIAQVAQPAGSEPAAVARVQK